MVPSLAWYWQASRAHRYSVLFALPLLVAYEVLAVLLAGGAESGVRSGADVMLKGLFLAVAGHWGPTVFELTLIGVGLWLVVRDMRRHGGRLSAVVFPVMLAEASVLALAFGVAVASVTTRVLSPFQAALAIAPEAALDVRTRIMLSLGAGLYEELLFRVVLVALLAYGVRVVFGWRPLAAGAAATVLGALVFSAFHYVGPYGDPVEVYSFTYRTVAGLFFSALYLARGFGITAWTHALYDVLVLVVWA